MTSITSTVALAALFASVPVWAQSAQVGDRVVTPSAFLGVDLQGDFLAEVPECAAGDDSPDEPCRVETKKPGRFEVRGLPYLPISPGYKLFATVVDGGVRQLVLTGKAGNLYLVKEMLTDRLGKPATSTSRWVKLSSGASYEVEDFKWNTQEVAVDFGRDLNNLDHYLVTFHAPTLGDEMTLEENVQTTNIPSP
ncbi:hypothetical protein [Pseudomonas sp. KU43P]|uniref:hypothetical protein n=1 Tax=Pseudomonas sp. KU43P TaxID=2487887 RepID=UPI0012A8D042|nr:hypothetical protein [Pseudomonas sp. KU43P]BBH47466.1 hypothetical protein KU43P_39430 [Pseudomonas sp. KU43P]